MCPRKPKRIGRVYFISCGGGRYRTSFVSKKYIASGRKWELYKNDRDPWPSKPHLHNTEEYYEVLDPFRGIVYDKRTRKPSYKVPAKEMAQVLQELKDDGVI